MRTFVTVFIIASILVSLIVFEHITVDKFCNEFSHDVDNLKTMVNEGYDSKDKIKSILDKWNNKKDNIYVFINHNSFKDIEEAIYNIKYLIDKNRLNESLFYINNLSHNIKGIKENSGLSIGNIL